MYTASVPLQTSVQTLQGAPDVDALVRDGLAARSADMHHLPSRHV